MQQPSSLPNLPHHGTPSPPITSFIGSSTAVTSKSPIALRLRRRSGTRNPGISWRNGRLRTKISRRPSLLVSDRHLPI
ncbi:hypothetical protein C8Q74DRAFT_1264476 [Fomes fomentarius]|nr:hypothetical protein C8Q74DRAFT_1264476 [Fomes fomentarius]